MKPFPNQVAIFYNYDAKEYFLYNKDGKDYLYLFDYNAVDNATARLSKYFDMDCIDPYKVTTERIIAMKETLREVADGFIYVWSKDGQEYYHLIALDDLILPTTKLSPNKKGENNGK